MIRYIVEKKTPPMARGPGTQNLVIILYPTLCSGWFYSIGDVGNVKKIDEVFSSVCSRDAIDVLCEQEQWKLVGKVQTIDDGGFIVK